MKDGVWHFVQQKVRAKKVGGIFLMQQNNFW